MKDRTNISSGAIWEDEVGYSRAVKIGRVVEVSGTSAIDRDKIIAPNDPYQQTKFIIRKIERAINEAGGSLEDVIRTRIYVTNIDDWSAIGKAHGEFFRKIKSNILIMLFSSTSPSRRVPASTAVFGPAISKSLLTFIRVWSLCTVMS